MSSCNSRVITIIINSYTTNTIIIGVNNIMVNSNNINSAISAYSTYISSDRCNYTVTKIMEIVNYRPLHAKMAFLKITEI